MNSKEEPQKGNRARGNGQPKERFGFRVQNGELVTGLCGTRPHLHTALARIRFDFDKGLRL